MCKPNINATITLYKDIEETQNGLIFKYPFDGIEALIENDVVFINDFFITLNFCLMKSTVKKRIEKNVVISRGYLECQLSLCKILYNDEFDDYIRLNEALIKEFSVEVEENTNYALNIRKNIKAPKIILGNIYEKYAGEYFVELRVKRHIKKRNYTYRCADTYENIDINESADSSWETQAVMFLNIQ